LQLASLCGTLQNHRDLLPTSIIQGPDKLIANSACSIHPRLFNRTSLQLLILPIVVEQILAVSIGMADTIMISSVGEAAISGVSLVDTINTLFVQLFAAIATGGAVVVSQYIGQKDRNKAGESAKQLIYTSTLLALIIMTLSLTFNRNILSTIFGDIEQDVMQNAEIYFTFTLISYPFLALYNAGAALFRSMGDSRTSMNVSLVMSFLNVTGNAVLIYGAGLGAAGAGIATLSARLIAALLMIILLMQRSDKLHLHNLLRIRFQWPVIKRILRIGVPSGIENSVFHIGRLLVQSLVASFGTAAIAANAIANVIASFANIPGSSVGLATITVVGQCMGAGEHEQASFFTKRLLAVVYIALAVIATTLFIFVPPLVGLFNLSEASSTLAIEILRLLMVMNAILWPLSFALPQALRAAGDAKFTMIVSILSMWTFRVGFSHLLGSYLGMGLAGVWIAMYIDWFIRSICFSTRFLSGKWKLKIII